MQINPDGTIEIDADFNARVEAALALEILPAANKLMRSPLGQRIFDELVGGRCEGDARSAEIVLELRDGTEIHIPFSLIGREH